jgi:hypothetical protein
MKDPVRTDVWVIFSHSDKSEIPRKSFIIKKIHRGLEWDDNPFESISCYRDCAAPWIDMDKVSFRIVRNF